MTADDVYRLSIILSMLVVLVWLTAIERRKS